MRRPEMKPVARILGFVFISWINILQYVHGHVGASIAIALLQLLLVGVVVLESHWERNKRDSSKHGPPTPYSGPFWNKPSADFLQGRAHPFSEGQARFALVFLLIPFAALVYLLLRY